MVEKQAKSTMLETTSDGCGDSGEDKFNAGNGYGIAKSLIPFGICRSGDRGPPIGKALESFTLHRGQAADELGRFHDQLVLSNILLIGAFGITASQGPHRGLIDKICGILVLPGALRGSHFTLRKLIYPLAAEYGMVIGRREGVGYALLNTEAIPTVLRLAVNGIAGDAQHLWLLCRFCHQGEVISARSTSC